MARPSMMLRSNNKLGYAIFISSSSGSMKYTSASTLFVKSSVVQTFTFVPVDDSAAKCAAVAK
eukprot:CAMPEP_0198488476 /NCGR_PEP_ID=MMETSP1462-20131121/815_1 /TAXON_ID=1333877 /ORGANISM="Brandtodinium nutriculum, Strain RCC3387" /LENGTH=62 /DNA_ID=CAMNT_0044216939 /DNA_START=13 /DNA_END=201 /DNA_ORIENTATION=-